MIRKLNIVSFDIPYPPIYGGIIDVFYKLKALSEQGIEIYLHTFEYRGGKQEELHKYCKTVFYYDRSSTIKTVFSITPFIINSRKNGSLILNLKKNNAPILFEGLHTTYPILKSKFGKRKIVVRTHNIEHKYYWGLAKSERVFYKKVFYFSEALKLKRYQKLLNKVDFILSLSLLEFDYFDKNFKSKAKYIPVFHKNIEVKQLSKKGSFALYHGDLRVSDNLKAVLFLLDVFKNLNYRLVITGNNCDESIIQSISNIPNISFVPLKNDSTLIQLFNEAHINILPTFQITGVKLKLINALFNGRFCLVNNNMIKKTGLENLCVIANTKNEFRNQILKLANKNYLEENREKRKNLLKPFNNLLNAKKIIDLIY